MSKPKPIKKSGPTMNYDGVSPLKPTKKRK